MAQDTSPLISVDELASAIDDPTLVLLDVRWSLGRTDGRERYLAGHIPGARYVDLDRDLAAAPSPARGRHPLPDPDDFQRTLRTLGVTTESTIVVYDQAESFGAARLWWMLRNAGVRDVRVLNGGLDAWARAKQEQSAGNVRAAAPGDVTVRWGAMPSIDIDEAAGFAGHGILLDARAGERYRGEVEPIDPKAGHIPGAVNAPTTENVDESGVFFPAERLRERFGALGLKDSTEAAVYCGSGITAAHQVLAMELAGIPAALFAGSWSQWANDPSREVATGATP